MNEWIGLQHNCRSQRSLLSSSFLTVWLDARILRGCNCPEIIYFKDVLCLFNYCEVSKSLLYHRAESARLLRHILSLHARDVSRNPKPGKCIVSEWRRRRLTGRSSGKLKTNSGERAANRSDLDEATHAADWISWSAVTHHLSRWQDRIGCSSVNSIAMMTRTCSQPMTSTPLAL